MPPRQARGQPLHHIFAQRHIPGTPIFDLQIALTAVESGAREIWTHDRDFLTLPGLRVRNPLD
jgi:predicted nucleic acid-binding protein